MKLPLLNRAAADRAAKDVDRERLPGAPGAIDLDVQRTEPCDAWPKRGRLQQQPQILYGGAAFAIGLLSASISASCWLRTRRSRVRISQGAPYFQLHTGLESFEIG